MKRFILLIVGILWYVASTIFIIQFVRSLMDGSGDILDWVWLAINYFSTVALIFWQGLFVKWTCDLYGESGIGLGADGFLLLFMDDHPILGILQIFFSPILLLWNLLITLKAMWWLLFHRP